MYNVYCLYAMHLLALLSWWNGTSARTFVRMSTMCLTLSTIGCAVKSLTASEKTTTASHSGSALRFVNPNVKVELPTLFKMYEQLFSVVLLLEHCGAPCWQEFSTSAVCPWINCWASSFLENACLRLASPFILSWMYWVFMYAVRMLKGHSWCLILKLERVHHYGRASINKYAIYITVNR